MSLTQNLQPRRQSISQNEKKKDTRGQRSLNNFQFFQSCKGIGDYCTYQGLLKYQNLNSGCNERCMILIVVCVGVSPPLKMPTFYSRSLLNLQTVRAPFFRQSSIIFCYIILKVTQNLKKALFDYLPEIRSHKNIKTFVQRSNCQKPVNCLVSV